jgi:hypothetical protein
MPYPTDLKNEAYDLYCGRGPNGTVPAPTERGWLGNPIKLGERCRVCGAVHQAAGSTLPCYEAYLRDRLSTDKEFREAFLSEIYASTRLGCFCKPGPCHTDIITHVWEDLQEISTQEPLSS